jgi:outer membrane immunogenic protein
MLVGKSVRSYAAAFGALVFAGPALAADFYGGSGGYNQTPPPGPTAAYWQGPYLGISFGWAWSTIHTGENTISLADPVPFSKPGTNGMIGSGVLGYNAQAGVFVYGVEVDVGELDAGVSGTRTSGGTTVSVKSDRGLYGDITGRAGVTLGNALIYGKGGFAFFTGNVHVDITPGDISQNSGAFTGWTVGGGVEYKFSHALSLKGEYQYFDLSNTNFSCCVASATGKIDDLITAHSLKVGLNFYLHDLRSPLD